MDIFAFFLRISRHLKGTVIFFSLVFNKLILLTSVYISIFKVLIKGRPSSMCKMFSEVGIMNYKLKEVCDRYDFKHLSQGKYFRMRGLTTCKENT